MIFLNRTKPSFIIIGGVKCASTSLFRYLIEHPLILPGKLKEPGFFNNRSLVKARLLLPLYAKNFPSSCKKGSATLSWPVLQNDEIEETTITMSKSATRKYVSGEATATYCVSADPYVVKTILPKVRIIYLVRNPTDRFISHYNMHLRFHKEGRTGYSAKELLPFIESEIKKFKEGRKTQILHQGLYMDYIPSWKKHFDEQQMLVAKSTELNDTETGKKFLNEVTMFLKLPPFDYSSILTEKFNVATTKETSAEARCLLDDFYKSSNESLHAHTGILL